MHRQVDARRWARLLGTAALGAALAVGTLAALPTEAAAYSSSASWTTFDVDPDSFSEEGTYGDSGTSSADEGDMANSVDNGDMANSVDNGDMANSVEARGDANSV